MKSPAVSSIIVCGIVRDAGKGLKNNIPVIDELCSYFKDYRIYVYENDSKDDTKELLMKWHQVDPERIHVSLNSFNARKPIPTGKEVSVNPFFSRARITKMADLRNNYLNYIEAREWTADYLMVFDFDIAKIECKSILSSFHSENDWDVVTAFGYSTSPKLTKRYHDSYALVEYGDDEPQTEDKIKELSYKYGRLKANDNWIRVFSAFGGLAIYKYELVKGLRYGVIDNNDRRVEVRCEHYSLSKQMAEKQDIYVYINPGMKLKYQNLTPRIIIDSIKRSFCG